MLCSMTPHQLLPTATPKNIVLVQLCYLVRSYVLLEVMICTIQISREKMAVRAAMKIVLCSLDVNVITADKVVTNDFSVTESICFINVKYKFHFSSPFIANIC